MDAEALQTTVDSAIVAKRWITVIMQGCGSISIRPVSIEISLATHAVISGEIAALFEHQNRPPTTRELHEGQTMRRRIQNAGIHQGQPHHATLTLDTSDVKAILVYHE